MTEKLADFGISVKVESDDLLLFGDAIEKVQKGVWTTSDAIDYLKLQVQQYQDAVNNAKEGSDEWKDATRKLNQAQEELAASKLPASKIEMKQAADAAKQLAKDEKEAAKEADNASKNIHGLTKKAILFLGQYLAIKKTFSAVMGFAKEGEELARMAQLSGTSAESIQKLGIALKNYGGSASSASSTLGKLNKQMEDLKFGRGGKLGQAAIRYGLDINASSPEQMLMNIAKRMEGMGALQQVNLGRMLGLDDATIMLLQQGVAGVAQDLEKAGKLTVFTKEDIENTQKMQRAYREFQQRFDQLKASITRDFIPKFKDLFEFLGRLANWFKDHREIIVTFGELATTAFVALFAIMNPTKAAILAVSGALALLIDDYEAYKEGAESYLKPVWEWWDKIYEKIKLVKDAWESIMNFLKAKKEGKLGFSNIVDAVKVGLDVMKSADSSPFNGVTSNAISSFADSHNKNIHIDNMYVNANDEKQFMQSIGANEPICLYAEGCE